VNISAARTKRRLVTRIIVVIAYFARGLKE
jgi:hypothetical protein